MRFLKAFSVALSLLALLSAGCGGSAHPDVVPVSGTVTFQGQPLAGAQVVFHNDKSPRAASGETDAQGKFKLTSFEPGDGATIGEYRVSVSKIQGSAELSSASAQDPSAAYSQGMNAAASGDMSSLQKHELPTMYANPETSGLTATVTADGGNEFTFDLTAE
jgi:hypothetical protein